MAEPRPANVCAHCGVTAAAKVGDWQVTAYRRADDPSGTEKLRLLCLLCARGYRVATMGDQNPEVRGDPLNAEGFAHYQAALLRQEHAAGADAELQAPLPSQHPRRKGRRRS